MNESVVNALHAARRRAEQAVEVEQDKIDALESDLHKAREAEAAQHNIAAELKRAWEEAKEEQ